MAKYIRVKGAEGFEDLNGLLSTIFKTLTPGVDDEGAAAQGFIVQRSAGSKGHASLKLYDNTDALHWNMALDFSLNSHHRLVLTAHATTSGAAVETNETLTNVVVGPDIFATGRVVLEMSGKLPSNGNFGGRMSTEIINPIDLNLGSYLVHFSGNGHALVEIPFELVDNAAPQGTE